LATPTHEPNRIRDWPRHASAASKALDENELALAHRGIEFTRRRQPGGDRQRRLRLVYVPERDAGRPGTGPDGAPGR